jgi:hypothetical protein
MPELVRHDITKNDKEIVELTRYAHAANKHPRLRPGSESQLIRRRMEVACHLLGNKFQYEPGEPRDITARNQRKAIGGMTTAFQPAKIYSRMPKNTTHFDLRFMQRFGG